MKVEKKLDRRLSWAVVVALASAIAACGDEDRPPASESAPISSVALGGTGSSDSTSDDSSATASGIVGDPPKAEPGPCEPRSNRECKIYYRDASGQLNCPVNVQICSVDGTEWLPCGEYTYDENGDPQPLH